MKITQGYQSLSMSAFQFLEMHKLTPYQDITKPLVVFGCYSLKDIQVIRNHKSTVVIQWEGLDSKAHKDLTPFKAKNIINVSPLPNVVAFFKTKGITCFLIRWVINEPLHPQLLGDKIYSYVHKGNPKYYGSDTIAKLNTKYEILTGDYTLSTKEWKGEPREKVYSQTFVGLQLCNYAGGGFGIVELGLRGIKVITNVLSLPHTIPWNTVEDIENAINKEANRIGTINKDLAIEVYDAVMCSEKLKCYDLDQLLWN